MEMEGIERPPLALSKTAISDTRGAKSDARDAPDPSVLLELYPDLTEIIRRWPHVPANVRAAILVTIRAGHSPEPCDAVAEECTDAR
jgi:hypothetical protein